MKKTKKGVGVENNGIWHFYQRVAYCCFLARAIGQLLLCGRLWWLVAFPFQPRWEINCRCRQSLVGGVDQLPPLQCSTWAAAKQFLVWVWICYPGWLGWWCQSGFLRPLENWQPRMLASWEHPTSCRCTPNFRCGWRDGATASRPSKPASNWVCHSNWTLSIGRKVLTGLPAISISPHSRYLGTATIASFQLLPSWTSCAWTTCWNSRTFPPSRCGRYPYRSLPPPLAINKKRKKEPKSLELAVCAFN